MEMASWESDMLLYWYHSSPPPPPPPTPHLIDNFCRAFNIKATVIRTALPTIFYTPHPPDPPRSDDESGRAERAEVALLRGKHSKGRSLRNPPHPTHTHHNHSPLEIGLQGGVGGWEWQTVGIRALLQTNPLHSRPLHYGYFGKLTSCQWSISTWSGITEEFSGRAHKYLHCCNVEPDVGGGWGGKNLPIFN